MRRVRKGNGAHQDTMADSIPHVSFLYVYEPLPCLQAAGTRHGSKLQTFPPSRCSQDAPTAAYDEQIWASSVRTRLRLPWRRPRTSPALPQSALAAIPSYRPPPIWTRGERAAGTGLARAGFPRRGAWPTATLRSAERQLVYAVSWWVV